jgi:hypothetical protein
MNKMAITGLSLIQLKGNYYVHSKKKQSPDKGKRLPAISENSPSVMRQGTRIKKSALVKKSSGFFLILFILNEYLVIRNEGQSVNIPC